MGLAEWSVGQMADLLQPDRPEVAMSSPEGRKVVASLRKGMAHICLRSIVNQARTRARAHNTIGVQDHYEDTYRLDADAFLASFDRPRRTLPYRLAGETIVWANPQRAALASRHRLLAAIASLEPETVCEIGFGSGQNLIFLASQLPDIRFSGYELAQSGTDLARSLQQRDLSKTTFGRLFDLPPGHEETARRIQFDCGSAFELPCPDSSFDVVFTHSALEQMHAGLPKALAEIRRVAKRYVVLHEPLVDVNGTFERMFLFCNNYFRMRVERLAEYGLRPLQLIRNLPQKPTFAYGIVIAEVV